MACAESSSDERKQGSVRTYSPKAGENVPVWHVIDASDVVLGRLATHAATLLRGKHKTSFAPHIDMGDFVIIINAEKIQMTGKKLDQRTYFTHSGHPGAGKFMTVRTLMEKRPNEVVRRAVKGMLPKNTLGRKMLKKLKVYAGPDHPHQAQRPEPLEL
jgi:large subunit ribosomal protein L13